MLVRDAARNALEKDLGCRPDHMRPLDFVAAEILLLRHSVEYPHNKTPSSPVALAASKADQISLALAPADTAYRFLDLPQADRDLAKTNLRFYAKVASRTKMQRLIHAYMDEPARIFSIDQNGVITCHDQALLRQRAPVYLKLLCSMPNQKACVFADDEDIGNAERDEGGRLVVYVRESLADIGDGDDDDSDGKSTADADAVRGRAAPPKGGPDPSKWKWRAAAPDPDRWGGQPSDHPCAKSHYVRTELDLDRLEAIADPADKPILARLRFRAATGTSRCIPTPDRVHLNAIVNAGKSTLARAAARDTTLQGGRACFITLSTEETRLLLRKLTSQGFEPDEIAIAVGEGGELKRLENMEVADRPMSDMAVLLKPDWSMLGVGCALEAHAEAKQEYGDFGLPERSSIRPCDRLTVWIPRKKDGKGILRAAKCGYAEVCPSVERFRRLRDCKVLIATLPALISGRMPTWIDPEGGHLLLYVYRNFDTVFLDEVDQHQENNDGAFFTELPISGDQESVTGKVNVHLSMHQRRGHTRYQNETDRIVTSKKSQLDNSADLLLDAMWTGRLDDYYDRRITFSQDFLNECFNFLVPNPPPPAAQDVRAIIETLMVEMEEHGQSRQRNEKLGFNGAFARNLASTTGNYNRWAKPHAWRDPDLPELIRHTYGAVKEGDGAATRQGATMMLTLLAKELGNLCALPTADDDDPDVKRARALLVAAFHADNLTRNASYFLYGTTARLAMDALGTNAALTVPPNFYKTYLPIVASGPIVGFRIMADTVSGPKPGHEDNPPPRRLRIISVDYIARDLLDNLETVFSGHYGHGPQVIRLSGTSLNPMSSQFHLRVPVTALLTRVGGVGAVADSFGRFMPMMDGKGVPIRVMGQPQWRHKSVYRDMAEALRGGHLDKLLDLAPSGRKRVLFVTRPIRNAAILAEHGTNIGLFGPEEVAYLRGAEVARHDVLELAVSRANVDRPEFLEPLRALCASRYSMSRGHNLMVGDVPAFGVICLTNAPHPVPTDTSLAQAWLVRRSLEVFDSLARAADPLHVLIASQAPLHQGFLDRSMPYIRSCAPPDVQSDEIAAEMVRRNQLFGRGVRNFSMVAVAFQDAQEIPLARDMLSLLGNHGLSGLEAVAFEECFTVLRTILKTMLDEHDAQSSSATAAPPSGGIATAAD